MRLSILVCSLIKRRNYLSRLLCSLTEQIKKQDAAESVEILIHRDDGGWTIGEKRQALLEAASGEFLVYIDDDDYIVDDFVEVVLKVIQTKPVDYIGYQVMYFEDGIWLKPVYHSIKYKDHFEDARGYYRNITHINPIRSSIAKQFVFDQKSHGEDTEWSKRIWESGLIKSEEYIGHPMYFYLYNREKRIREIEPWPFDKNLIRFIS